MQDVVLVSMPFAIAFAPSLALALLKATLKREQISVTTRYYSIPFAERIGQALYSDIATGTRPSIRELAGEWIWSHAVFERTPAQDQAYVDAILRRREAWTMKAWGRPITESLVARLERVRGEVEPFLVRCLDEVLAEQPRVVGLTSMFQQHTASLALARRIKRASPTTVIVMGGANCEGVMGAETVRRFPYLDAAVSGEGDVVFPELVRRVRAGQTFDDLPGVRTQANVAAAFASRSFSNGTPVRSLDDLPYPEYDDYFEQFARSRYQGEWQPSIYFESSRGCWWGEKAHCTFCGLNGTTMAYRSKTARRAMDELVDLSARHPGADVEVVDNILDMSYFKDFLPELAARKLPVDLFYETKANLRKDQIRALKAAGVNRIQPGIESLSDSVLKLMRKGVSAAQNVQLLKWCAELGVEPYWNLLWGFPGEDPAEYEQMARVLPLLVHFRPPSAYSGVRLDRFSPNFTDAEHMGFTDVEPLASYGHVYPVPLDAVANLAYYFTFRYRDPRDVESYVKPLLRELRAWKRVHSRSALLSIDTGDHLALLDVRPAARRAVTVLGGLERALYLACDQALDARSLVTGLGGALPGSPAPEEVERRLEPLVAGGLVLKLGAKYLALALPWRGRADARVARSLREALRGLGVASKGGVTVPLDWKGPFGTSLLPVRGSARRHAPAPRLAARAMDASRFTVSSGGELVVHT